MRRSVVCAPNTCINSRGVFSQAHSRPLGECTPRPHSQSHLLPINTDEPKASVSPMKLSLSLVFSILFVATSRLQHGFCAYLTPRSYFNELRETFGGKTDTNRGLSSTPRPKRENRSVHVHTSQVDRDYARGLVSSALETTGFAGLC